MVGDEGEGDGEERCGTVDDSGESGEKGGGGGACGGEICERISGGHGIFDKNLTIKYNSPKYCA